MAIRLRIIRGQLKALCARITKSRKDDIYLNDNVHDALATKFLEDFKEVGLIKRRNINE